MGSRHPVGDLSKSMPQPAYPANILSFSFDLMDWRGLLHAGAERPPAVE